MHAASLGAQNSIVLPLSLSLSLSLSHSALCFQWTPQLKPLSGPGISEMIAKQLID
jgi:hypothetical protein